MRDGYFGVVINGIGYKLRRKVIAGGLPLPGILMWKSEYIIDLDDGGVIKHQFHERDYSQIMKSATDVGPEWLRDNGFVFIFDKAIHERLD